MDWERLLPFLRKHAKKTNDYIQETFDRVRNISPTIPQHNHIIHPCFVQVSEFPKESLRQAGLDATSVTPVVPEDEDGGLENGGRGDGGLGDGGLGDGGLGDGGLGDGGLGGDAMEED